MIDAADADAPDPPPVGRSEPQADNASTAPSPARRSTVRRLAGTEKSAGEGLSVMARGLNGNRGIWRAKPQKIRNRESFSPEQVNGGGMQRATEAARSAILPPVQCGSHGRPPWR
jgi:hypothetical protein